ncbi:MAG: PRC-barrel domain-containing protein [Allorhizobium sp.]|jgi:sporulation protein YlmC with PRC-barrel domain
MNKSFKTLAAAVLLGSTAIAPFAIAQDAGTGATTTPPAATGDATGTAPAGTVSPDATTGGAAGTTGGAMGTTAQDTTGAATGNATYLTEQAENHISVNDFMGQPIYTADNESIGDINDLLVEKDGGVVAAVVGVGGFLGIGQKNVAIPFENITITREVDNDTTAMTTTDGTATTGTGTTATGTTATDTTATGTTATGTTNLEQVADAEVRLTTTETAESLRNAPEFRTLSDQAADAGSTGMVPTDNTTTSSTDQ